MSLPDNDDSLLPVPDVPMTAPLAPMGSLPSCVAPAALPTLALQPEPVPPPVIVPVPVAPDPPCRSACATASSERMAMASNITQLSAVEKAIAESCAAGERVCDTCVAQTRSTSRGRIVSVDPAAPSASCPYAQSCTPSACSSTLLLIPAPVELERVPMISEEELSLFLASLLYDTQVLLASPHSGNGGVAQEEGRKVLKSQFVFHLKCDQFGMINRWKACFVVKGCAAIPGVDFTKTKSPTM